MNSKGRFLYLIDPLRRDGERFAAQLKNEYPHAAALIFDENERWLQKAQRMFAEKGFYAIAAEGNGCAVALAVAAQLPVEQLTLENCGIFDRERLKNAPAQLRRIAAFARRNLSLVASEIRFISTPEGEIRRISESISVLARIENGGESGLLQDCMRY